MGFYENVKNDSLLEWYHITGPSSRFALLFNNEDNGAILFSSSARIHRTVALFLFSLLV